MKNIKRFLFIAIFLLTMFILASVVWYSPVLFKGYSPSASGKGVLMARNIYQTGLYSAENNLDVLLSTNLIKEQGCPFLSDNKLTPLIYSQLFKVIGAPSIDNLVLLSIFIHALTLLIFTGIIIYLFDLKIALVFSLIYIFLPFNWQLPYYIGGYEFALLFLSLFFLFYFYGIKKRYNYIYLPISGIFLILACLSKEALLLITPFLLLFLWFKKQRKSLFYVFIPFAIIFVIFWLPNVYNNPYINLFISDAPKEVKSADLHLYPDPYTYYFEKEEFLTDLKDKIDNDEIVLMKELDRTKELKNVGAGKISLFDRAKLSLVIGSRHIFRFVSLEEVGGPFILLLIFLGLYSLRQKKRYLYHFFVYWVFSSILLMSFVVLAVRNHLMDFGWAIALLISLGILVLGKIIIDYFQIQTKKATIVYLAILLAVLYHLVLVNHIAWSNIYDNSNILIVEAYGQEIKKLSIVDEDVIAVNLDPGAMYNLNYLTNKSVVIFKPETVEKLLAENKLDWAFEQFGVKYVLGYSDELSEEIVSQTASINIASNSLKPAIPEISRNKGWFMNLVK